MTKDTFKQFVNKDGYAKGGVPVEESPQNLELDPRSKSSIRGRNYIAQGDSVDVRGTKAIRKEKKPVKATWYIRFRHFCKKFYMLIFTLTCFDVKNFANKTF